MRRARLILATAAGCAALAASAVAFGAIGDLDFTFDGDGKVVVDTGAGNDDGANAVAIRKSDKAVIAAGYADGANRSFAVAVRRSDGAIDAGFNGTGSAVTPVGSGDAEAYAVLVQKDGKILVGGRASNGSDDDFALARYTSSGALDAGFGSGGIKTIDFGHGDDEVHALAQQADGRLLVAGSATNANGDTDFAITRLKLADGALDTQFDADGKVTLDVTPGADDVAKSIIWVADVHFVVAGQTDTGPAARIALARYGDGNLDNGFGNHGVLVSNPTSGPETVNAAVLKSDSKIVVVGSTANGSDLDLTAWRFTAGGLDKAFGTGGQVVVPVGTGDDEALAATILSNKTSIVGYATIGGTKDLAVVRLNSKGTIDKGFSGDGITTFSFGTGDDVGRAAAAYKKSLAVAGTTESGADTDTAIARIVAK